MLRLEKHIYLAMAPPKAIAAGRVCIALTHILWQRLQIHFGISALHLIPEFIFRMRDLHAQRHGTRMDASQEGTIAINMVKMVPRVCTARCHGLCRSVRTANCAVSGSSFCRSSGNDGTPATARMPKPSCPYACTATITFPVHVLHAA